MVSPFSFNQGVKNTRLIFVRHGQIESNVLGKFSIRDEEPLNSEGIEQIKKTSVRIREQFEPDVMFCSPIFRAKMSAQIIGGEWLEPIEMPDLAEYDFGEVSGLTLAEISEQFPDSYKAFVEFVNAKNQTKLKRPIIPGGETLDDVAVRVSRFTDYVLETYPGKVVVAVSHGAFIKIALQVYTGRVFNRSIPFWIDNGSITVVDFYRRTPIIRLVNDFHHISDEIPPSRPAVI